ncbi:hypothetical protein HanLR1_Chr05g0167971 [Helianthus annuus]|nr:hypothetical protein HanLR1_Chr05g0167971 [Helianthus annuus]
MVFYALVVCLVDLSDCTLICKFHKSTHLVTYTFSFLLCVITRCTTQKQNPHQFSAALLLRLSGIPRFSADHDGREPQLCLKVGGFQRRKLTFGQI